MTGEGDSAGMIVLVDKCDVGSARLENLLKHDDGRTQLLQVVEMRLAQFPRATQDRAQGIIARLLENSGVLEPLRRHALDIERVVEGAEIIAQPAHEPGNERIG